MNSKLNVYFCIFFIFLGGGVCAQDSTPLLDAKAPTAEIVSMPKELSILRTNCYTNVRDCAGLAHFKNKDATGIGCTIWWNNGAQGRSNFVLEPGGTHAVHVRYNDTMSCVWKNQAPPADTVSRYYILVQ